MNDKEQIRERIQAFFDGSDPMERIIKIECGYNDDKVTIIYRREDGKKRVKKEPFRPFVWAKQSACRELFGGDKKVIKQKLETWGIECKGLRINRDDGTVPERMKNGYRVLFQAKQSMTYSKFMDFFKEGGMPIYPNQRDRNYGRKDYMAVSPVEQFMIYTGKRQFKGYDDYDDLVRMQWDLETEGLDPEKDAISQIGVRTNKGFEKVIKVEGIGEEKRINEIKAIREFFQIIHDIQPDVISGHNTENFDWNFIDVRLKPIGGLESISKDYLPRGVYKKKKQQVLKLGGEMEYYYPTVMWGYDLTDSLFAVRRAQAIDSNIKSANLKYITKYSGLNKKNRVYVPGKLINSTWEDKTLSYIFNDENGNWMKYDSTKTYTDDNGQEISRYSENNDGTIIDNKTGENFELTSGRYIVERYLLDDLYETDKVELQYNQSNYLVSKMIPVPFEKVCTMGTAAIWKYIMMAWSYENNLAIPEIIAKRPFVGGLSRLIKVGYVDKVIKYDMNSLYPSIELTYGIRNEVDVMDVLLAMLEYVLTKREYFKEQKAIHGNNIEKLKLVLKSETDNSKIDEIEKKIKDEKKLKNSANTLQLPLKILGNSYFGGSSCGTPFPWTDTNCIGPEQTTCTGRQILRLMIYYFSNISKFDNGKKLGEEYNYMPIVGDSFTGDTPLFIKYNDSGLIDIKPISSLINEKEIMIDGIGREYDYSAKKYKVLCRSGWVSPEYIYRHNTDKSVYRVSDGDMVVDVTEDHSLFDYKKKKLKPKDVSEKTKLEYYKQKICHAEIDISEDKIKIMAKLCNNGKLNVIPIEILNSNRCAKTKFLSCLDFGLVKPNAKNKTFMAGLQFLMNSCNFNV